MCGVSQAEIERSAHFGMGFLLDGEDDLARGGDMDTKCVCDNCKRELEVSFAQCILHGWPRCCGKVMLVQETTVNVESVVSQILAPIYDIFESTENDLP